MAYLVRIGAFRQNVSGVGSRGYHAFRRGRIVTTIWGGVEVRPGRKFYWSQTTAHKIYQRASDKAARAFLKEILNGLIRSGYSRLPTGAPIRRTAKSAGSARRD